MPIATRLTNTGTLLVNGSFDENTSIAPAKFRTTSTTVSAGTLDEVSLATGAVSFNGTTQYLTVPDSINLQLPTQDFTLECWFYLIGSPTSGTVCTLIQKGTTAFSNFEYQFAVLNTSGTLRLRLAYSTNGASGTAVVSTATSGDISLNTWYHAALTRSGTSANLWLNGGLVLNTTIAATIYTGSSAVSVGANTQSIQLINGYISNLRVVKGTAVYTANFTPPQAILPAITNTQLLLNVTNSANFIRDNSTNNFTVTNNGTATWTAIGPFNQGSTTLEQRQVNDGTLEVSTQFDEWTGAPVVDTSLRLWLDTGQPASYPGSGSTWTDLSGNGATTTLVGSPTYSSTQGGYLTFDGSTQYGNVSQTTTLTSATFITWIYSNANQNSYAGLLYNRSTNTFGFGLGYVGTNSIGFTWNADVASYSWNSGLSVTNGVWCMVSVTVSPTTTTAYLNTTASTPLSFTAASQTLNDLRVANDSIGSSRSFNGRISQVMMYNRALSADEITTNFNALRGRYGI
jgi:hypothetical protein